MCLLLFINLKFCFCEDFFRWKVMSSYPFDFNPRPHAQLDTRINPENDLCCKQTIHDTHPRVMQPERFQQPFSFFHLPLASTWDDRTHAWRTTHKSFRGAHPTWMNNEACRYLIWMWERCSSRAVAERTAWSAGSSPSHPRAAGTDHIPKTGPHAESRDAHECTSWWAKRITEEMHTSHLVSREASKLQNFEYPWRKERQRLQIQKTW